MAATSSDKLLIGAAALLALASAGAFGYISWRNIGVPGGPPPTVELSSEPYKSTAPDAPPIKTETWAAPVAQTRGRDWIYDAFTPPEIFYNAKSKQFYVKPPTGLADEEQEPFGIELVAARPEPFRLQLFGYSGENGTWKGMFQNVNTGEVIVTAAPRPIPKLQVTIKSFSVTQQDVRVGDSPPVKQRVATAVVHDEKTGRDTLLTNRERVFTGTVFATVAASGENTAREVRTGDSFKIGEASYKIEKINTTPPSIEIVKEAPTLSQPDRRTLTPREPDEPDRPDGGNGD